MMNEIEPPRAEIMQALRQRDLDTLALLVRTHDTSDLVAILEREDREDRALIYRMLAQAQAIEVFEMLDPGMRTELITGLGDGDVGRVFEELDPDDRAQLLDELPATVAKRLMSGLSPHQRELTAPILGYPRGSVGRRISTEYVSLQPQLTLGDALSHVRHRGTDAETIYTLPVTDSQRHILGIIGLRALVMGRTDMTVGESMTTATTARATDDAEATARRLVDANLLAMPVVDGEERLLGILTIDDAAEILEVAEDEDAARQGASEPLRRPYLSTPVLGIVRSRVVWLLVLAVSALLTVQVLGIFEATLEEVVTLALFIPLLTGTAGNAGAQAATTVTRALAVGEVEVRDVLAVAWREIRVGATLGAALGTLGFALASLAFGPPFGVVIGLTLFLICSLAPTVGGAMPILASVLRADPAVFSTPFISTFCDATSLIIYFLVATSVLQL